MKSPIPQLTRRMLYALATVWALLLCAGPSAAAQDVTVTNTLQNHYHYSYTLQTTNCSAGRNVPSGQYPSTYHLERGHFMHHYDPKNTANDYWVYWAHFDNSSYGIAEVAIFKSATECGPYILQTGITTGTNTDGSGYGFQPGGWQSRDEIIYNDATTQTYNNDGSVASYANGYFITASNSLNSVKSSSGSTCSYANDSLAIFKMTPDYLGVDYTSSPSTNGAHWAFVCDQREAPVMFRKGSKYFLISSQAAGWYPSQGGYGVSNDPLTGWTADPIALGNTSTFGGQTSDGFEITGSQATTYMLTFDHLGGDDSKNPASSEKHDTGEMWLPVQLDDMAGTATLSWLPSFTVNLTSGILTTPSLPNLAKGITPTSTVATNSSYPLANATDGLYSTRWAGSIAGTSASFSSAKSVTSQLCPVSNATTASTCNPSLVVDLGSVQPVQQIDLSFYMLKGSEAYYNYKIAYSADGQTWSTNDYTAFASTATAAAMNLSAVPFSVNNTYGFNSLPVNFSARFVALIETAAITQNSTSSPYQSFYGPNVYEMAIIKSTAPAVPSVPTVTVSPSTSSTSSSNSFTVGVTVTGTSGTPSGYVQLSAPGYLSEVYGLVAGANNFTIPAGAITGGDQTITVSYRADPTSVPLYGTATTTGTAPVHIDVPAAPTNLAVSQASPNALGLTWTAAAGATGYAVNISTDGGGSYTQTATSSTTSYLSSGLTNGQSYCYTVASINAAGTGAPSTSACATATSNFPVTGITVTPAGPDALAVNYSAVSNATGYTIKRSVSGAAYTVIASPTSTTFTDAGLTNTNYCYTVAAVFSTGTGADSPPVCATATNSTPPSDVQVTPWASGALYLTWVANGSPTSYTVKRSVNSGAYSTLVNSATAPYYINTGLTNGTLYCYIVEETLNGVTSTDTNPVCGIPANAFISVPNASFETPVVNLWSTTPSFTNNGGSWTFVGNGSNAGNNSGISALSGTFTNANTPPIPLGNQVGLLEGTGSITQSISGFTPGVTYTIMITASQRQASAYQSGGANPITVTVNGSSIGTLTPPQAIGYYRDYSLSFTASSATNAISFVGGQTNTASAVLFDNVRIFPSNFVFKATPNSYVQGQGKIELSASINYNGPQPTGYALFSVDGSTPAREACNLTSQPGVAGCGISWPEDYLSTGDHNLTVYYSGDSLYPATSSSATITINAASNSVTINLPPQTGQTGTSSTPLSVSGTFSGPVPTGAVGFLVDGTNPLNAPCALTGPQTATCELNYPTGSLSSGVHILTVFVLADGYYQTSSASSTLTLK